MTVQQWVPGHSASLWPASSDAAGRLLADLHSNIGIPLPTITTADVLSKATRQAHFVAELLPPLRAELNALVPRLAAKAPHTADTVTSHGNFYAGQLLAEPSGLVLLDVDRMCRAAPAYDLACFVTHLAFGRDGDADVVKTALDSLLTGYGSRPSDLDWYLSACLLRRAAVPFRFQDEDWPQAATELVRLAREVLA
jgi:Ser/Thr protein kinase RdoA (MazF antagonist)